MCFNALETFSPAVATAVPRYEIPYSESRGAQWQDHSKYGHSRCGPVFFDELKLTKADFAKNEEELLALARRKVLRK
jgi:hypothetical protein